MWHGRSRLPVAPLKLAAAKNPANMGTLAGVDENGELNQQVPGLGRGDDTDMPDGDLADKWLYLDGYGERPCTIAELTARSKAREEAARVSQRISAEEAKAKTVPAAQEPERPAENQTADAQHRKLMRLSITIQASRKKAAEFLQSLELNRGLIFMKRMHDCERTRFADVEADARLQAAVEAGRCGRWLTADGVKWKADIALPRRRYSHG